MHQDKTNKLRGFLYASRYIFVAVALFSLLLNLLMLVSPFYMLQIYDRVLTSRSKDTLYALTLLAAGLLALSATLDLVRARILTRLGTQLERHMMPDLFAALIEDRVSTRKAVGTQPIRDFETLRSFLNGPGLTAFFDAPWMPFFLTIIFLFHPWLGTVALCGALLLFVIALLSETTTRQNLREASLNSLQAHRFAESSLRNADVIWAMGMRRDLRRRWQQKHLGALAYTGAAADRLALFSAMVKFARPLVQMTVLGLGAYLVIEQQISAGVMIAASIIMGRALAPVEASITHWRSFVSARLAYGRVVQMLRAHERSQTKMALPAPIGAISVESATLVPPGASKPTLMNISFKLAPGELLGVIGPSAAGKSCLARMLMGIWPPKMGHVRLDGADIAEWDREQLGGYVGYLPQDVELFDGTVAENIARFQEISPDAVVQAAQIANAHELILRLPKGYETQIGEGGSILSGGQRQRVGLTRAIYQLPRLVVLDEPNANLDAEGEAALRLTLQQLKELSRTVIVISHKQGPLADADKLLVLECGKMLTFGPKDEVLKALWKPQAVNTQPRAVGMVMRER